MNDWLKVALSPSVVKRALKFACVVGTILITINHLNALLKGDISTLRLLQMGLTVMVPYTVSTLSSVAALRQVEREAAAKNAPNPAQETTASRTK